MENILYSWCIENNKKILLKQWNWTKNGSITPDNISYASNRKFWWKCDKNHEWRQSCAQRTSGGRSKNGTGCPYCSNKKIMIGYNDLATTHSEILMYWNYKKNKDICPQGVTFGSAKKVWWICSEGHEWESTIINIVNGNRCPVCSGQKVISGFNDLQTINPELSKEWNMEKNGNLKPCDVSSNTGKKVWWICNEGHEWESVIGNRNKGVGCPTCKNKKVLKGYNDLATNASDLLDLWDYEKNIEISPEEVTSVSGKKVWWRCEKGHSWNASIAHIRNGRRCPICSGEQSTSFPEQAIYFYFKKYFPDTINRYKYLDKYEIDIFVPSLKLGIEYDGWRWHSSKEKLKIDSLKDVKLKRDGYELIRILELKNKDANLINNNADCFYYEKDISELNKIIKKILSRFIKKISSIDINKDRNNIYNQYILSEKESSFVIKFPDILDKWDYSKNLNVKPEFIKPRSEKTFWWKCEYNHSWQATVHAMTAGLKCPICEENRVIDCSLEIVNPLLAKEWHYKMNKGITPSNVLPDSSKKVCWICEKGHEWQATISSRNRGNGCPICSNKIIIKGINDIPTTNPDVAMEWDYVKNTEIDIYNIGIGSGKRGWWICSTCGHQWNSVINTRKEGKGCSICSSKKMSKTIHENAIKSKGSLSINNPNLAREWDFSKNKEISPDNVTANSGIKAWWLCSMCNNSWETTVANRNKGGGCPKCALIIRGKSRTLAYIKQNGSLLQNNPELCLEWHQSRNDILTPSDVTSTSRKKVWWICEKEHEWQAEIISRTRGASCPICKLQNNSNWFF